MTTTVGPSTEHAERVDRVLVLLLITRRELTPQEASLAVGQARRGEVGPHTHLVTLEAAWLLAAATAPVRAALEALAPFAETAARAMADLARVMASVTQQLATANRSDRPTWASPYGPPPRGRRR
ncbi:hypothetical protein ACFT0G_25390 [Streptomyces sp. NPDC057020]|uniref:hypothetical protein n=1 Tax=unclassified Streptomyces TaxID=2593676 RepID=UPI003640714A